MKPADNLLLAKWLFPEYEWKASPRGRITGQHRGDTLAINANKEFSISDVSMQTAIVVKLAREYSIIVEKKKHGWVATTHEMAGKSSMTGEHTHRDLGVLLVQIVRGLQG